MRTHHFSHCKCLYSRLPNYKFGRTGQGAIAVRANLQFSFGRICNSPTVSISICNAKQQYIDYVSIRFSDYKSRYSHQPNSCFGKRHSRAANSAEPERFQMMLQPPFGGFRPPFGAGNIIWNQVTFLLFSFCREEL